MCVGSKGFLSALPSPTLGWEGAGGVVKRVSFPPVGEGPGSQVVRTRCVAGRFLGGSLAVAVSYDRWFALDLLAQVGLKACEPLGSFVACAPSLGVDLAAWRVVCLRTCVVLYAPGECTPEGAQSVAVLSAGMRGSVKPVVTQEFYAFVVGRMAGTVVGDLQGTACRCGSAFAGPRGAGLEVSVERGAYHAVVRRRGAMEPYVCYQSFQAAVLALLDFPGFDFQTGTCYLKCVPPMFRFAAHRALGENPTAGACRRYIDSLPYGYQGGEATVQRVGDGAHVLEEGRFPLLPDGCVVGGDPSARRPVSDVARGLVAELFELLDNSAAASSVEIEPGPERVVRFVREASVANADPEWASPAEKRSDAVRHTDMVRHLYGGGTLPMSWFEQWRQRAVRREARPEVPSTVMARRVVDVGPGAATRNGGSVDYVRPEPGISMSGWCVEFGLFSRVQQGRVHLRAGTVIVLAGSGRVLIGNFEVPAGGTLLRFIEDGSYLVLAYGEVGGVVMVPPGRQPEWLDPQVLFFLRQRWAEVYLSVTGGAHSPFVQRSRLKRGDDGTATYWASFEDNFIAGLQLATAAGPRWVRIRGSKGSKFDLEVLGVKRNRAKRARVLLPRVMSYSIRSDKKVTVKETVVEDIQRLADAVSRDSPTTSMEGNDSDEDA